MINQNFKQILCGAQKCRNIYPSNFSEGQLYFTQDLREIPIGKLIDAPNKNPEFKIAVQLHDGRLLEQVFPVGKIPIEKLT